MKSSNTQETLIHTRIITLLERDRLQSRLKTLFTLNEQKQCTECTNVELER